VLTCSSKTQLVAAPASWLAVATLSNSVLS